MYKGKKILLENGTIQVDLLNGSEVIHSHVVENDGLANAYIIPWVAQEGYTKPEITSDNYEIDWDNFDDVYLYKN